MSVSAFKPQTLIEWDGRRYLLLRELDDETWQLEDFHTRRVVEAKRAELLLAYEEYRLIFIALSEPSKGKGEVEGRKEKLRWLDPEAYEIAKIRRSYVEGTLHLPMTRSEVEPVLKELWKKLEKPDRIPSFATVARWRAKYLRHKRDVTKLVDRQRGSNRAKRPARLELLVLDAIKEIWLTEERRTVKDTLDRAIVLVAQENNLRPKGDQLPLPTRRYVHRLIYSRFSAYDRVAARKGKKAAQAKFRAVHGKDAPVAPLERVEADHTPLNVIVVEEETGLPIGRPWLTVCIDVFTRCVLGFYIGFEPPSYVTVARCLKNAIMPKVKLLEEYPQLKHPWPAYGVPQELIVDNGPEFHSDMLEQACQSLGFDIVYCKTKAPWEKGTIERFLGTINRGTAHTMPGKTFASILDKEDYDPKKHAIVTFRTLKTAILMWINNYYHQSVHSTTKAAPSVLWKASIRPDDIPVASDPARLDLILGRSESYTLTHAGIRIEELDYNSTELTDLRKRLGDKLKVEVRIDDGDLSHIMVISPDRSEYFRVPCLQRKYATAGFTRWMHNVCRRYRATRFPETESVIGLALAKQEIADLIAAERAGQSGKARASAKGERFRQAAPEDGAAELPVPMPKSVPAESEPQEREPMTTKTSPVRSPSSAKNMSAPPPEVGTSPPRPRKKFIPIFQGA